MVLTHKQTDVNTPSVYDGGGIPAKARVLGLVAALLLLLGGCLAYSAVLKRCAVATHYFHATGVAYRDSAETAVVTAAAAVTVAAASTFTSKVSAAHNDSSRATALHSSTSTPCSAAAQVARPLASSKEELDMDLLKLILPLTNFSSMKSADLLDHAAAANGSDSHSSKQALRELMLQQSTLFCKAGLHLEPLPGSTSVNFGNVSLFVYASNDIVSGSLMGSSRVWEALELNEVLWALRQFSKVQQYLLKLAAGSTAAVPAGIATLLPIEFPTRPLFVDVGANVGWFSLNAAAAGARVAAFEAMASNVALVRRSLCANPLLAERVALHGTGLGPESKDCYIISGSDNHGDGITVCDKTKEEALQPGYEVRGEMTLRRLDTLLAEDVQVMKMDVEGFEQQVLQGATELLTKNNVWYIMAECNIGMIGEARGQEFIRSMDSLGYAISPRGFRGPFWTAANIQSGAASCKDAINLFSVKKAIVGL